MTKKGRRTNVRPAQRMRILASLSLAQEARARIQREFFPERRGVRLAHCAAHGERCRHQVVALRVGLTIELVRFIEAAREVALRGKLKLERQGAIAKRNAGFVVDATVSSEVERRR